MQMAHMATRLQQDALSKNTWHLVRAAGVENTFMHTVYGVPTTLTLQAYLSPSYESLAGEMASESLTRLQFLGGYLSGCTREWMAHGPGDGHVLVIIYSFVVDAGEAVPVGDPLVCEYGREDALSMEIQNNLMAVISEQEEEMTHAKNLASIAGATKHKESGKLWIEWLSVAGIVVLILPISLAVLRKVRHRMRQWTPESETEMAMAEVVHAN